jgi:ribose transport system substrate-binding protein
MGRAARLAGVLSCVLVAGSLQGQTPAVRTLKIAMIAKSSANFLFLAARKGAEDAAAALSAKHAVRIEVLWLTPAKEDVAQQVEYVSEAVQQGAGAILIACSDGDRLTPALNAAVDKGLVVMTFDADAPASKRFAYYGPDDADLGGKVVTDLAALLSGQGKIAVLAGNPDAGNLRMRADGVKSVAAAKFKGLEVVEVVNHVETPQAAAAAMLKVNAARPDLAGWALVGGWPLFRSSATPALMADLLKRNLKVVSVDALPEQLNYVDKGIVPVLWAQPVYLWGKVGVDTIVDKVVFKKEIPEHIRMEPVRVTRENLGTWARQLKSWGFTGLPQEYLAMK